jgi:hypothetical protein
MLGKYVTSVRTVETRSLSLLGFLLLKIWELKAHTHCFICGEKDAY